MNLKPIPMFGLGTVGKSVNVSAQQRTNLYMEVAAEPEVNIVSVHCTPGLVSTSNYGASPARGVYTKGDLKYAVFRNVLWSEAADGTKTNLGTLSTFEGRVDFADNGTQIIVVDGPNGYIHNTITGTFVKITAPGFPGGTSVAFLNGRFIVNKPSSGQFSVSALYDGQIWDPLYFANAESDPDALNRVMVDSGQIVLFGEKTTEFWGDSGAQDFPYARVGSSAVEFGLAARWSAAKYLGGIMFLGRSRLGQVQVYLLAGNTPTLVSSPEIESVINSYSAVSDATAFSYLLGGHAMYQINFPSQNASWLYDGQSKSWSKLVSGGGRHRAEMQFQYLDRAYVSDYENGKIYRLDPLAMTDDGMPIVRELVSRHQTTGNPSRLGKLWVDLESGTGLNNGQGKDPQLMLRISRDGGHTYGSEIWSSTGRMGQYGYRAQFNRLGQSRDWVFKLRITDPVKVVMRTAWGVYGG